MLSEPWSPSCAHALITAATSHQQSPAAAKRPTGTLTFHGAQNSYMFFALHILVTSLCMQISTPAVHVILCNGCDLQSCKAGTVFAWVL